VAQKTHYDELHVTRDAPQKVVRAAYRVLSQQHHPDRTGNSDAGERMRSINAAWAVLSDAASRRAYDATLETGSMDADPIGQREESKSRRAQPAAPVAPSEPLNVRVPAWLLLAVVVVGLMIVTATLSTKAG